MYRKIFKTPSFLLLLSSFLLMILSWFPFSFSPLIFLAFLPLFFFIEKSLKKNKPLFVICLLITTVFLSWNLYSYLLLYYSNFYSFLVSIIGNSILMSIPFWLIIIIRRYTQLNELFAFLLFVLLWAGMEWALINWELTQPWLILGNAFSNLPHLVQWYSFTTVTGGSIWIILINIFIFWAFFNYKNFYRNLILPVLIIIIPLILSLILKTNNEEAEKIAKHIKIISPGFHPLKEKRKGHPQFISYRKQLDSLIKLSKKRINKKDKLLVWPENCMPAKSYDERMLVGQKDIKYIYDKLLQYYPDLSMVTGLSSYNVYYNKFDASTHAQYIKGAGYYSYYNSAIHLKAGKKVKIYHKKHLIPWVEKTPYYNLLNPVSKSLNIPVSDLGRQENLQVFNNSSGYKTGVIINNEILYPFYIKKIVKNKKVDAICFLLDSTQWGWIDISEHINNIASLRSLEENILIARAGLNTKASFIYPDGSQKNTK